MRIVDIRETAVPLNSTLANSSIDFREMTTSVVARIENGFISLSDRPSIGFEGQARLYKIMHELAGI